MATRIKRTKRRWEKYSYDIDKVKNGDKIAVMCDHNGCNRFLVMVVNYSSTMQCTCLRYKNSFDMRNQVWYCHQHKNR